MNEIQYYSAFKPLPAEIRARLWQKGHPFLFQHEKPSDTIVICLHGYTAAPFETRPIADASFNLGLDVAAPLLPGHGFAMEEDQKEKLSTLMKEEDMFESVRNEIRIAREQYENVYIYGQSMGGILALSMAGERLVDACATTATDHSLLQPL
ncbi:MAG: hypothetical protein GF364_22170 [Candidatus Lokiarchaeota archaeon]|nr:hypothetical protein [Candidatus Lokiarchaeota archaeon]